MTQEYQVGDIVTTKSHWGDKTPKMCRIVGFWSLNGPFIDVQEVEPHCGKIRCIRREDIIVESMV